MFNLTELAVLMIHVCGHFVCTFTHPPSQKHLLASSEAGISENVIVLVPIMEFCYMIKIDKRSRKSVYGESIMPVHAMDFLKCGNEVKSPTNHCKSLSMYMS